MIDVPRKHEDSDVIWEVNDGAARRAFRSVVAALKPDRYFPENVFSGEWSEFLFFESDRIFVAAFAELVAEFLRAENAGSCCLLNLGETTSLEFDQIAAIFLDGMIPGNAYERRLRGGGPAVGWLYGMDRYGCASDIGDWCIYCEKQNDIAVIGLRSDNGATKFRSPLEKLRARPIETLCDGKSGGLFPFTSLTIEWRRALIKHYGSGSGVGRA